MPTLSHCYVEYRFTPMNIDFNETFKSLSTAELLNIVNHPTDYQPEAVSAANGLLKDRTIEAEDITEAEKRLADIKEYWIDEKAVLHTVSDKIENLVDPIVHPDTKVDTKKWINILTVILGIYVIWSLTVTRKFFPELNDFKRDFNPPFRPFPPEKHHRIIDARLEGNKKYPSKFIFIENRMSQAIVNKYSTSRILEKVDQLNRSFTYTFDDRDFYRTTKVNIIEVVSGKIVQVCDLNRTDLTI